GPVARRPRDAAGGGGGGGGAVVAGRDHGGDAGRAEVVDDGLLRLAVAGRREQPTAETQVDRGERVQAAKRVDALQPLDDVGGVGHRARRGARSATVDVKIGRAHV